METFNFTQRIAIVGPITAVAWYLTRDIREDSRIFRAELSKNNERWLQTENKILAIMLKLGMTAEDIAKAKKEIAEP